MVCDSWFYVAGLPNQFCLDLSKSAKNQMNTANIKLWWLTVVNELATTEKLRHEFKDARIIETNLEMVEAGKVTD